MRGSYPASAAHGERKVRQSLDNTARTPQFAANMITLFKILLAAATGFILLAL